MFYDIITQPLYHMNVQKKTEKFTTINTNESQSKRCLLQAQSVLLYFIFFLYYYLNI